MKRRRFLQLAAGAAAGVLVQHSAIRACSAGQIFHPTPADVLTLAVDKSAAAIFDASQFRFDARGRSSLEPFQMIEMLLERNSEGIYQWTIDGRSQPVEVLLLQQSRRYRLRMMNATAVVHTVHLRHHCFELARIHQIPVSGIFKDMLRLERYNVVEADVLMSRSGPILLRYPNS
jgi:hypothetical protein